MCVAGKQPGSIQVDGRAERTEYRSSRRVLPWLIPIVCVAIALHARQLFLGRTFVLRDQLIYTWTERKVLADALRAGRIPEWNDLVAFGTQFAASSANGVTYPIAWLVALVPLPLSMDVMVALHVLIAGIGVALFARRLGADVLGTVLAGAAFMSCGYVASISANKIFPGTAWLPWVAYGVDVVALAEERRGRLRAAALLASVVAVQLLAGDPAASITSAIVAVTVACSRASRRVPAIAWVAGAYATALLLAACGVLPALALLPHTARGALSPREALTWSLHPWRLLELVWPGFLGNPLDRASNLAELVANSGAGELDPSWSLSLYLGAPVLALAILAGLRGPKGSRGLWIGIGALMLLALGVYTPLYRAYRAVFPPEQIIRYPEKHVAGAICLLCALAGAALPGLSRNNRAARRTFLAMLGCVAMPLAVVALFRGALVQRLSGAAALTVPPIDLSATFAQSLESGIISLLVAVTVSGLLLLGTRARFGSAAAACGIAVYLLHSGWHAWAITAVEPAEKFTRTPSLLRNAISSARSDAPPPRIYRSPAADAEILPEATATYWHQTLYLDSPGRFGFAAVPGFEGWRSVAFSALRARAAAIPLETFLRLYAIDYVALPSDVRRRLFTPDGRAQGTVADFELGFSGTSSEGATAWSLISPEGTRPRAFVAPRWRWSSSAAAVEEVLRPGRAADAGAVVITGEGQAGGDVTAKLTPCAVTRYQPEQIVLDCDSMAGGYAVLADENAPGWSALVDGRPAEVVTADVLLRAVRVEKGRHRIELSYRTPVLRFGLALSVVGWLGWLAVIWSTRRATALPEPVAHRRLRAG